MLKQASISSAGSGQTISMVFVATLVSCCSGGVVALVAFRFRTGYWKLGPTINGALAGKYSMLQCRSCRHVVVSNLLQY